LKIITAKPLLVIYREKAEQRRLATLKQSEISPDRQIIGEREEGKAIEQFARVVHSNAEKGSEKDVGKL